MEILYEDNHIIIVNKCAGEIVQGDKTGDEPLSETLKRLIKERDAKPGNVFMGVVRITHAQARIQGSPPVLPADSLYRAVQTP